VPAIAAMFETILHRQNHHETIGRAGLSRLREAPGRGAKLKWQASDLEYLTDYLEHEPQTSQSAVSQEAQTRAVSGFEQ
jgi:hypothetical protein